ncbi:MAG TPA: phosphoribosylglycinamide formyltransferase [Balneolaceae bacterium]|nr:phosphoribosylglycinamide formyltransferase [Balneolaceae bacterium]
MKRLVFFASGSGTNFQSVIDTIHTGPADARIYGLVSNKPKAGALERAKKHDIPVKILSPASFATQEKYAENLLQTLQAWQPDLIVLAGYLLKIPPLVIKAYPEQIINIHPSLLPKFGGEGFYGKRVHKAVIEAGEAQSGCTVHIVDEAYDQGPVLEQRRVPVLDNDTPETLAERVLEEEHELLPEVILNYFQS